MSRSRRSQTCPDTRMNLCYCEPIVRGFLLGRMPSHLHPLCTPTASPFAHQRLLWCIRGSNSLWGEFVCGHGICLLTKRGNRPHTHHPKRTKISNISSVQHANAGCSHYPFSRTFRIYPPYPPPPFAGHTVGTNKTTMTTASENPPSWHKTRCPREIYRAVDFAQGGVSVCRGHLGCLLGVPGKICRSFPLVSLTLAYFLSQSDL